MKLAQPQTLPKKIGLCPKSKRAKKRGVGGKAPKESRWLPTG